MEGWVAVLTLG